jgi:hypothetical protein
LKAVRIGPTQSAVFEMVSIIHGTSSNIGSFKLCTGSGARGPHKNQINHDIPPLRFVPLEKSEIQKNFV